MRVLLDTNVLAGGMTGEIRGSIRPPSQLWRRWRAKQFDLIVSAHLLDELERTLSTAWFRERTTPDAIAVLLRDVRDNAIFVEPIDEVRGIASHWQDDLVLAAAVSGKADYLVTGDAKFRRVGEYLGVKLCTPAEFLNELDELSF